MDKQEPVCASGPGGEYVECGYIKAKFLLPGSGELMDARHDYFTSQFKTRRVTANFVYITIGHDGIRDNEHARSLLKEIAELSGKVTRLDFSVDLCEKMDIPAFYKKTLAMWSDAETRGLLGMPSLITSPTGDTCYIGKRSSARMLRVYDKRAEILKRNKTDIGFDLTRYEIEIKRNAVRKYMSLFLAGNTKAILDDMCARYRLERLSDSPERIKCSSGKRAESSCWAFIERYKRIIREAYVSDTKQFVEIIGVKNV